MRIFMPEGLLGEAAAMRWAKEVMRSRIEATGRGKVDRRGVWMRTVLVSRAMRVGDGWPFQPYEAMEETGLLGGRSAWLGRDTDGWEEECVEIVSRRGSLCRGSEALRDE
jgi:hypothetical protein